MEIWLSTLDNGKKKNEFKYLSVEGNSSIFNAPCIKVCGMCIGTDKVGHFVEEGYLYYRIAQEHSLAYAIAAGEYLEGFRKDWGQEISNFLERGRWPASPRSAARTFPKSILQPRFALFHDQKEPVVQARLTWRRIFPAIIFIRISLVKVRNWGSTSANM